MCLECCRCNAQNNYFNQSFIVINVYDRNSRGASLLIYIKISLFMFEKAIKSCQVPLGKTYFDRWNFLLKSLYTKFLS